MDTNILVRTAGTSRACANRGPGQSGCPLYSRRSPVPLRRQAGDARSALQGTRRETSWINGGGRRTSRACGFAPRRGNGHDALPRTIRSAFMVRADLISVLFPEHSAVGTRLPRSRGVPARSAICLLLDAVRAFANQGSGDVNPVLMQAGTTDCDPDELAAFVDLLFPDVAPRLQTVIGTRCRWPSGNLGGMHRAAPTLISTDPSLARWLQSNGFWSGRRGG